MILSTFPRTADLGTAQLGPVEPGARDTLAAALAAMPPWSTLQVSADTLARVLSGEDPSAWRYVLIADGVAAGVLSVRFPWLKGPYIELLAVLPGSQRRGLGTLVLSFVEAEAVRLGGHNVWVCASQFNVGALAFYKQNGFVEAGCLPDLVADGFAETLLRKKLT